LPDFQAEQKMGNTGDNQNQCLPISGFIWLHLLPAQISQVLLDCLNFSFQFFEISFQFSDLFSLRLIAPLKVPGVSATFTAAIATTAAPLI
jgi:hypothetical protein